MDALTHANYRTPENEAAFMSHSQYESWCDCPAKRWAIMRGLWKDGTSAALLGSSYGDVALLTPDDLPEWVAAHMEDLAENGLVSKGRGKEKAGFGEPLASLSSIMAAIDRAKATPQFMALLEGEHQRIFEFEIGGVPWKGALDNYQPDVFFSDLKIMADLSDMHWIEDKDGYDAILARIENVPFTRKSFKGPWYEEMGYWRNMAVYWHAIRQNTGKSLPGYLCGLSKQGEPGGPKRADIGAWEMADEERFSRELQIIEMRLPRVLEWKHSETEPPRCERTDCAYCVSTRTFRVQTARSERFF